MGEKTVAVSCAYDPEGPALPEILEESFRLYLIRSLAEGEGKEGRGP